MTWYERRELALAIAATLGGWNCVRVHSDRHIARLLTKPLTIAIGKKLGTIPRGTLVNLPVVEDWFAAKQKRLTMSLPK